MGDFFKKMSAKVASFFKNMKKGQRIRLIIFVTVFVALILFVVTFLNQKSYTVLYSGMEPADAGAVMSVLSDMNMDAKAQGSDTILVPAEKADELRMELAAQGYPQSGYNFDIFKNASGLGTTDMEKKVYLQFQLQENLRQTIKKLDKVKDAIVNITLADDSAFVLSDNNKKASAAVMLTLKSGQTVTNEEVRAIAELVSKSVSGLQLDDVRIIDSRMKLYSLDDGSGTGNVGSQLQMQQEVQNKLQKQVMNLLTPVFGTEKVLAEVNVTLDFDSKTTESVAFSPPIEGSDKGIAVSMQELAETIQNYSGGSASGAAGTSSNDGTNQYPATTTDGNNVYNKVSNETNYELNQTKTQIENAKGKIQDLSVSVLLDSSNNIQDYTEGVKKLVATAIGVDSEKITVEMLPFMQMENADTANAVNAQTDLLNSIQSTSTLRIIIIAAAILIGVVILALVIKSLKRSPAGDVLTAAEGGGFEAVISDQGKAVNMNNENGFKTKENTNLDMLEKYIDKSPESVAQLLRNWLTDDYGR